MVTNRQDDDDEEAEEEKRGGKKPPNPSVFICLFTHHSGFIFLFLFSHNIVSKLLCIFVLFK